MSEADTPWARLASRATRVVLTRKDVTYSSLAQALADDGVHDGERAIVSRISRGTLRLSFFLHVIALTKVRPPALWTDAMRGTGDWQMRAAGVIRAELSRQPSEFADDLAARLGKLGTTISPKTLSTQISTGAIQFSLFLQLLYVLNSDSLDRYIDQDDLAEAARTTLSLQS
ncbi:DUF6471 domain-containing protein [Paraburkholderia tropica]|uniref:DUF6471 domain-containing protein n=1 Tax=Paraburkholderia tropica TaxID=92647 RepID=UPI002ABE64BC|nr:DUF6471 domain-containing protein [Paraburkholderia tropica]